MSFSSKSKTLSQRRKLEVRYLALNKLTPDPSNARVHNRRQVLQIAESINVFGFNVPVLVDQNLQVIAGHGRIEGARELGLTEVPTISLDHLTDDQRKAFAIADNKLTENSVWDERLLAEQFEFLSEVDLNYSLEATGFSVTEIDLMIEGLAPVVDSENDPADALPQVKNDLNVSKNGDLWILGKHRVFCGDSLKRGNYEVLMDGRRANVAFTDPPFNVKIAGHATGLGRVKHKNFKMAAGEMSEAEFTDFLTRSFGLLASQSVDGSLHYVCMDWRHAPEILAAGKHVFTELKNVCVWVKDNGGMGSLYRSQHELVFVFKSGKHCHLNNVQLGQYGRYRTNVWHYPGANSFSRSTEEGNLLELHPTVKPVKLVADAIMDCSARGDIVLDPFLGSGTTVIAAERTGRVCYGIELDPSYVDTIVRRWQSFTGQPATHAVSGSNFRELAEEAENAPKG